MAAKKWHRHCRYAIIQSLNRKGEVESIYQRIRTNHRDECHHVSAYSFEQVINKAKAKYIFGLTATPRRQDGQEAIVTMQLGPVRMRVDAKMLSNSRGFTLSVVPRYTSFQIRKVSKSRHTRIYKNLVADERETQ